MEKTDEELAILVKQNDDDAMEELFRRYKPLINKISRSYFLYGADKDDIMQEAMLGLYKACLSFNNKVASFYTFANICIKRKILDAIKIANSQKNKMLSESLSLDYDEDESENYLNNEHSPDRKIIENENFNELKSKIFGNLSDFELIVLKYYLQGENYVGIAQRLKKSPKSIDNALGRIRQKLRLII